DAGNNTQRDSLFIQWINQLGDVPECRNCQATPDSAFLKPDLTWIDKSDMDAKLKDLLHEIYLNRSQGEHYYAATNPNQGDWNPILFKNERFYGAMAYPDAGFRLLALYRYWNTIHYFYPYKHLTGKNWNDVLPEYISPFISTRNELDYELAALRLVGEVDDSHATLWGDADKIQASRGKFKSSVTVRFIENKPVVMEIPASDAERTPDLQVGDVITHINGKDVNSIVDSLRPYYPASNHATSLREIARDLLRTNDTIIFLECNSRNQTKKVKLSIGDNRNRPQKQENTQGGSILLINRSYKFLKKDIGYVDVKTVKQEDIDLIKKDFKNTKGIIIDIRHYPNISGLSSLLGPWFVSSEKTFVKFTYGNPDNPGEFTFRKEQSVIPRTEETYRGKLVVLVNEETQSNAEFTAMAFQAGDNTTVIGSQTAGADGNVSEIVLPGGLKTMISGIGVYYPDGRETQRIGIVPDIVVKPTIKGIREGRDEVLEKAIEFIEKK
ncbi:MAG: peptidase S41, partial [Tannerella sp.]|nr:peptidase S41 [Tannerella sp.]